MNIKIEKFWKNIPLEYNYLSFNSKGEYWLHQDKPLYLADSDAWVSLSTKRASINVMNVPTEYFQTDSCPVMAIKRPVVETVNESHASPTETKQNVQHRSNLTPHEHAEYIKLWADGYTIQVLKDFAWETVEYPTWDEKNVYRVKPSTLQISIDIEIPEPLLVKPHTGELCYTPALESYDANSFGVRPLYYDDTNTVHVNLLRDGLLHKHADAAREHCYVIRRLTRKKEK